MTVTVNPHGTFNGKMYAMDFIEDTNCVLTEQTPGSGLYSQTFSYTGSDPNNCGVVQNTLVSSLFSALQLSVCFCVSLSLCLSLCLCLSVCRSLAVPIIVYGTLAGCRSGGQQNFAMVHKYVPPTINSTNDLSKKNLIIKT